MDEESKTKFDNYTRRFFEDIDEACEFIINDMNERFISTCFLSARDFDDKLYIIYSVSFPWNITGKDKTRTVEEIESCFYDYMSNEIGIQNYHTGLFRYQAIGNGG